MKNYKIVYTTAAEKTIDKLDNQDKERIRNWINTNLEGCNNPRWKGSALTGNRIGQWRYRVGGYRIVAEIQDDKVIILIVDVDKRNDVYNKG